MEADTIALIMDRIAPMEFEITKNKGDMELFSQGMVHDMDAIKMKMEHAASSGSGSHDGGEHRDRTKPVMEYQVIKDLSKLGKDKSIFRDWKYKMKDGLMGIFKSKEFLKMMKLAESPETKMDGTDTMDAVMQKGFEEWNIPKHMETWEKVGIALKSLLTHRTEEKGDAFLMNKRSETGWGGMVSGKQMVYGSIRKCAE